MYMLHSIFVTRLYCILMASRLIHLCRLLLALLLHLSVLPGLLLHLLPLWGILQSPRLCSVLMLMCLRWGITIPHEVEKERIATSLRIANRADCAGN
ncbi:hypothetical protein GQ37_005770 [Janthinobacterium sp. BJB1]|nr:hypothetical protein GQ37_005770 [Janthinobacterium sp. BJB1]